MDKTAKQTPKSASEVKLARKAMANRRSRRSYSFLKRAYELHRETGLSCMAVLKTHKGQISYWASDDFDYKLRNNLPVFDANAAVFNKSLEEEKDGQSLGVRDSDGSLPAVVEPSPEKLPSTVAFITPGKGPSQSALLKKAALFKSISPEEAAPSSTGSKQGKATSGKAKSSSSKGKAPVKGKGTKFEKIDKNACANCNKRWDKEAEETWIYCDKCVRSTCQVCSGVGKLASTELKRMKFSCAVCLKKQQ